MLLINAVWIMNDISHRRPRDSYVIIQLADACPNLDCTGHVSNSFQMDSSMVFATSLKLIINWVLKAVILHTSRMI